MRKYNTDHKNNQSYASTVYNIKELLIEENKGGGISPEGNRKKGEEERLLYVWKGRERGILRSNGSLKDEGRGRGEQSLLGNTGVDIK